MNVRPKLNVPANPVLLNVPVVMSITASRVPVPTPEDASMNTLSPATGTPAPPAPPDEPDQQSASVAMAVVVHPPSFRTRYMFAARTVGGSGAARIVGGSRVSVPAPELASPVAVSAATEIPAS